jgi:putative tryptophan/tyrosine transport system substrate-binding protein
MPSPELGRGYATAPVHHAARRATTWPLAARAQQPARMRRIGVLMNLASDDTEGQARLAAFHQELQRLGWTVGTNVQIDYRWGAGDADRTHKYAAELVALAPDAILASGTSTVAPLQRVTRTVPIVFAYRVRKCRRPIVGAGLPGLLLAGGGLLGWWRRRQRIA